MFASGRQAFPMMCWTQGWEVRQKQKSGPLARPDSLSLCGTVRLLGGYDLYFDVGEDALVALHLAFELAEFLDV